MKRSFDSLLSSIKKAIGFYHPIRAQASDLSLNVQEVRDSIAHYRKLAHLGSDAGSTRGSDSEVSANYERIGHQLGSYRHYPVDASRLPHNVMPIVNLMRFMFDNDILDAVEVDVRTPSYGHVDTVFVTHDSINPELFTGNAEAEAYLVGNTLEILLNAFARENDYVTDRQIYIEIKTEKKWGPLSSDDMKLIDRIVQTLDETLEAIDDPVALQARKKIGFVSFNLEALKRTHSLTAGEVTSQNLQTEKAICHTFHLILGTNRPVFRRFFTKLTNDTIDQINRSPWLTGIWFDPRALEGLETTMGAITTSNPDLRFGLSTYYSGHERFGNMLRGSKLKGVESVIVEIDFGKFIRLEL